MTGCLHPTGPARSRRFGRLGQGTGTRADLRAYARPWFKPGLTQQERWGHVLTAAMLAQAAHEHGREYLAAHVAFMVLRTAWENPAESADQELAVARGLFAVHATAFWDRVQGQDPTDLTTSSESGIDAFITHPVRAARLCEQLSLLGLLARVEGDPALTEQIAGYLEAFLAASPGAAHPVSDESAFSLVPTVVLLAATGRADAAQQALRTAAIWLLDLVEHGRGISPSGAGADADVRQVLGAAYKWAESAHEPSAYGFTVLADLAHVCGFTDLYAEVVIDLHAVGAMARVVVEGGPGGTRLVARIAYSTTDGAAAEHHSTTTDSTPAGAAGAWFDCLATWATTRDRHVPAVLRQLVWPDPS